MRNLEKLNKWYPKYRLGDEYWCDENAVVYKLVNGIHKVISPYQNRDGYVEYVLTNIDKKKKHIMQHIISATLYVEGRTKEKNEVNHKDGVRNNNHPSNLEWSTHKDNIIHSYKYLRK